MKLKRLLTFAMIGGSVFVLAACASDNYDNGNAGVLIPTHLGFCQEELFGQGKSP